MMFAYNFNDGGEILRRKFHEFGQIVKIAHIKPCEILPQYGMYETSPTLKNAHQALKQRKRINTVYTPDTRLTVKLYQ